MFYFIKVLFRERRGAPSIQGFRQRDSHIRSEKKLNLPMGAWAVFYILGIFSKKKKVFRIHFGIKPITMKKALK